MSGPAPINEVTPARFMGRICVKHPELNGLRRNVNHRCVECDRISRREQQKKKFLTPEGKKWLAEYKATNQPNREKIRNELIKSRTTDDPEDRKEINKIYRLARKLRQSGFDCHVDHIVPLAKGGLHISSNLQILSAKDNLRKGSK